MEHISLTSKPCVFRKVPQNVNLNPLSRYHISQHLFFQNNTLDYQKLQQITRNDQPVGFSNFRHFILRKGIKLFNSYPLGKKLQA